jgi:hypothetical protein
MFKTDTGYLGLGHRSLEVGDKIYILMGGDVPLVLRPFDGKTFRFRGESYVHGIMDGEALPIPKTDEGILSHSATKDLAWVDQLDEVPWPFETEKLTLF